MISIEYLADHLDRLAALAAEHHREWSSVSRFKTPEQHAAKLRVRLGRRAVPTTLLALEDGELVGSACLVENDLKERPALSPWLASVYVTPGQRRRGIGWALVRRCVEEARALGHPAMYLYTSDHTDFYLRLGWRTVETVRTRGSQVEVMMMSLLDPFNSEPLIPPAAAIPVEVRLARSSDAPEAAALMTRSRWQAMPYLPEIYTPKQVAAWMARTVFAQTQVWVADFGGRMGGFISLSPGWVEHLYVLPEAQRRGIGSALLAKAKEQSPAGLKLYVFQRNTTARAFYERAGIRAVALTDGSGNEEKEPDALYEWRPGA